MTVEDNDRALIVEALKFLADDIREDMRHGYFEDDALAKSRADRLEALAAEWEVNA